MFFVLRSTHEKLHKELVVARATLTRQMLRIDALERENRQLRSQVFLPSPGTAVPGDSPTSVPPTTRDMQAWRTVRPNINRESTRHERVVEHRMVDDGFVSGMTTGMIAQSMMTPSSPPPSPPSCSSYDSGSSSSSGCSPSSSD